MMVSLLLYAYAVGMPSSRKIEQATYHSIPITTTFGSTALSAYIAPKDKLEGRDKQIFKERDEKLEAAREVRRQRRQRFNAANKLKPYYYSLTHAGKNSISF